MVFALALVALVRATALALEEEEALDTALLTIQSEKGKRSVSCECIEHNMAEKKWGAYHKRHEAREN